MKRALLKRLIMAASLGVAILAGIVVWEIVRTPSASTFPPVPTPNGYDDFLKASQLIAGHALEFTNSNPEILRPLVHQNQAALALIRAGIDRECRVPLQFTENYFATHLDEFAGFKTLARLLAAEGEVAEAEGRLKEAVRSYLDAVRFGHASARGGLAIDFLVAEAIQAIGLKEIHALRRRLSSAECRDTARILSTIDDQSEPADLIMQREDAFFRKTRGVLTTTWFKLMLRLPWMRGMNPESASKDSVHRGFARRRLLIVELALQNYKLEHGQFPNRLAALVPNYLNALPADPFTGGGFVYRHHDGEYRVYSIGPDRIDDSGKTVSSRPRGQVRQGDIVLD